MLWLKYQVLFSYLILFLCSELFASIKNDSTQIPIDSNKIKLSYSQSVRFPIHEIRILGNQKTKRETILRELKFGENNSVSYEELDYFEKRIFSLGIFNDVKIFLSHEENKNVLIILVQESWYIWPLPFVDVADRDWKKLTYGLNLNIQNLTGRNENLNTGISLGYDPKFYFNYFNPIFDVEKNLNFKIETQIQRRKNRSNEAIKFDNQSYDEKYFRFEVGLGKRLNIFNSISTSVSYEYIEVEKYFPQRTVSTNGIDRFLSLQLGYSYDSRDLTAYPKSGSNINLIFRKVGLGESSVDYNILAFEGKKIISPGFPVFYFRNFSRIIAGPVLPFYANSFIGYKERLRGYFNNVFEANSVSFTTFEIRFPLVEKFNLSFDLPLIPKELLTYQFSLDFHTFFDNAFMLNKNQRLKSTKAINGFGAGFSFLFLPYRSFNLELAFNGELKSQLIFDLNVPF